MTTYVKMLKINGKYKMGLMLYYIYIYRYCNTPKGLHKEEYQGCHPAPLLSRGGTALSSEHNKTLWSLSILYKQE